MKRKALFIGGTGTISTAITARIAAEGEWELTLLNRGSRKEAVPPGVRVIQADIADEANDAETAISSYRSEMAAAFVTGTRDLAEYDDYVQELYAMGLQTVLDAKNAAYSVFK